ncbi:BTB/POZ domain-containing protein At1g63850-like [Mercurialis annua]|uniref:BTB/POZ domain-containing protein At1g63850-like n=1 Tax=Mercurialis annua TaxID=3986 RepID=UPI00215F5C5E|nr:BTB/POZ domain-containing protein At1g63850-like [Mercurialis annua]
MQPNPKKRHRSTNHRNWSSNSSTDARNTSPTAPLIDSLLDKTVTETSQKPHRTSSSSTTVAFNDPTTAAFNDPTTADVILNLHLDSTTSSTDDSLSSSSLDNTQNDDVLEPIYLHSHILTGAKYFSALLSDRWQHDTITNITSVNLTIPQNSIDDYLTVLKLLYTQDFTAVINSVSTALDILPVASQLLFEDCVKNCLKFLEAVPWSEEEENRVINLIPFINKDESDLLLARVRVSVAETEGNKENNNDNDNSCEKMLRGLIYAAMHNHSNSAFVKAFVAKLLRDFPSRESAKTVLDGAFVESLTIVKGSLEDYASPDFRLGGVGGDYTETEAIQRLNLHTALTVGKHLLWLVERMLELRVADNAVIEWSEQSGFTSDLQRAFRDDAWRNFVPGLPAVMLRCTAKLANAVACGTILAARQVRMKLVKDWLPVLIACKDNVSPTLPSHKSLYLELEGTFLRIISTLPMSDAQELLKQCIIFSTRNVEDCPHLITAFNTWFRRAMRPS